jgi:protein-tyrosine phosphatase
MRAHTVAIILQVLVHCQSGVSRSAAVVVAFLSFSMGLGVDESLEILKMTSPQACPNAGFIHQLQLFVKMRYGSHKLSQVQPGSRTTEH